MVAILHRREWKSEPLNIHEHDSYVQKEQNDVVKKKLDDSLSCWKTGS